MLLVNQGAGTVMQQQDPSLLDRVVRWFRECGVAVDVQMLTPNTLKEARRQIASGMWDAIVAGGGDGTVGSVASLLAQTSVPLGILPLGTFNHFARDLDIPLDLEEAVRSLARSRPVPVDLAQVNDHYFVNNSSIGIYPRAVEEREVLRRQTGGGKKLLMIWAALRVLFRWPLMRVRLEMDGQVTERVSPFVFVGNNCYRLGMMADKLRNCLNEGCLSVLAARDIGLWGLGRIAWHALRDRLNQSEELDSWRTAELHIHTHKHRVRVALDGELYRLASPLRYRIHPGGLQVLAPG